MDVTKYLKAHGIRDSLDSDSESEGKGELDDNYYRHMPAPISEERLLGNIVAAGTSGVENQENMVATCTLLYSQIMKKCTSNTQEEDIMKKAKPSLETKVQTGTTDVNNSNQVLPPKAKENQATSLDRSHEELINRESKKLSQLIRQEIKMEFEKLKLEQGFMNRDIPKNTLSKINTQSLPSLPQTVEQTASKINKTNKKKVQPSTVKYVIEAKKIEKIFNYVDAADKCLKGIIRKTATNDQQEGINHLKKLHNVMEYIQYAHKALEALPQNQEVIENKKPKSTSTSQNVPMSKKTNKTPSQKPKNK